MYHIWMETLKTKNINNNFKKNTCKFNDGSSGNVFVKDNKKNVIDSNISLDVSKIIKDLNSDYIKKNKVSSLHKISSVKAFILDHSLSNKKLKKFGIKKKKDGWYIKKQKIPIHNMLRKDVIVKNDFGNLLYFSQKKFQEIYIDAKKYEESYIIEHIRIDQYEKGDFIYAIKLSTGDFVLAPEGTIITSKLTSKNHDIVIKEGQVVCVNEEKDFINVVNFNFFLNNNIVDPTNPTSKKVFDLIYQFEKNKNKINVLEKKKEYKKLVKNFLKIDRNYKSYKDYLKKNKLSKIKHDFDYATEVANEIEYEFKNRLKSLSFHDRIKEAEKILEEIYYDVSVDDAVKRIKESYVMIMLLPKTNSHQHLKGSVPKKIILKMAKKNGFSEEEIDLIKNVYKNANEKGFSSLDEFNKTYEVIARPVKKQDDYFIAIREIIKESVRNGQLVVEIRSAVIGQSDVYGALLDPIIATENMIKAIEITKNELREDTVSVSLIFLGYRGRDWYPKEVFEHAKIAIYFAKKYPKKKFGFDIAGPEDTGYAPSYFNKAYNLLLKYNKEIATGKRSGEKIGITTHAGETKTYDNDKNKKGVDAVKEVIKYVDRIGHGLRASDSKDLLSILKDKGIACEMCPTINNKISGSWEKGKRHYIQEFIENGVCVLLSTDNDGIGGTNIVKEYFKLWLSGHGVIKNWNSIKKIALDGIKYSFISELEKEYLINEFNYRVGIIEKIIIKKKK